MNVEGIGEQGENTFEEKKDKISFLDKPKQLQVFIKYVGVGLQSYNYFMCECIGVCGGCVCMCMFLNSGIITY